MCVAIQRRMGRNIERLRRRQRLSQDDLADRLDVEQSYISKIELGKRSPSLKTMCRIAEALNVDIQELFAISRQ